MSNHMHARTFGRLMKEAFELSRPPGYVPPSPPSPPPQPNPNDGAVRGGKMPGYLDVLDRWYNPWTKQQVTERGEHGLMRFGQTAMGVGALAGTAAAGIAAAPAVMGATTTTGGAAAGTAGGGVVAASQTPTGQNAMQRGAQIAGDLAQRGTQVASNVANTYQSRIAPALERLNYKPEDVLHDAAAAGTGNFDQIKGPGWGVKPQSMPIGAPSMPRPLDAWKNIYSAGAGMLPNQNSPPTVTAHM